ncbi:MAG: hypothetical protein ACREA9_17275 [Pyrinomonadaceae bacterium]
MLARKSLSLASRGSVIGMGAPPPTPPPPPMPSSFPNARSSGLFSAPKDAGFIVEDEDMRMHPSVQLFRKYPTDVIAGTLITPGDFAQTVA